MTLLDDIYLQVRANVPAGQASLLVHTTDTLAKNLVSKF